MGRGPAHAHLVQRHARRITWPTPGRPGRSWTRTRAPEVQKATLDGWFIDILPDLNQDDPEVARYIIQNTLWWVGVSGLDGIRQDTLPYVPRRFWRDWMAAIKRGVPALKVVGELFDGDPAMIAFFEGGSAALRRRRLRHRHPVRLPRSSSRSGEAFAQGKNLRDLAMMLARDHLYRDPGSFVTFLGLHDVPRFMNEPGATADGLKLAFTFLLTARGTPLVYYGDEIAMRGRRRPRQPARLPGRVPRRCAQRLRRRPAARPTEQDVFAHVRALARLRAASSALRRGSTRNLAVNEQSWAYARVLGDETAVVVLNNGAAAEVEFGTGELGLSDGAALEDRLGGAATLMRRWRSRAQRDLEGTVSAAVYVARACQSRMDADSRRVAVLVPVR